MYYLQDGPNRAFVCEELMHVSEDTQLPPDWVSEWEQSLNHFCNPPWVVKNNAFHGNNEIKKMSMLRRTYVLEGEVDAKFSYGDI